MEPRIGLTEELCVWILGGSKLHIPRTQNEAYCALKDSETNFGFETDWNEPNCQRCIDILRIENEEAKSPNDFRQPIRSATPNAD